MSNFELQVENEPTVLRPTREAVVEALAQLHPQGPSFVVLSREDGSYVQTAGAKLRLTVEYRKMLPSGFRHYTLGKNPADPRPTSINCRCGPIHCQMSESMTLTDAQAVFEEFYSSGRVPDGFMLRERTSEDKTAAA
jgi:hypothetical protein